MINKQTLLKSLASAALIIGLASGAAYAEKEGALKFDTNGDQQISKSEFLAGAQTRFEEADVNNDNFLSDDERTAHRELKRQAKEDKRFEKIDTNNDGQLSKDEIEQAKAAKRAKRDAKLDLNGDGTVDDAERAQAKEQRKAKRAEYKAKKADRAASGGKRLNPDTNDDGFVSLEEHVVASERMFTFLDANGDGVLTEGEGKRRKKKGGKKGKKKGYGS